MFFLSSKVTHYWVIPYAAWFSWLVYLQLLIYNGVYRTVNYIGSNFKKIPQSSGLSVPKTEIYCPYALIKLNFKVFIFYLMSDFWDNTWVVSDLPLLSRDGLWILGYHEANGTMRECLWIILDLMFLCGYFSLQGSATDDLCSLTINEKTKCSLKARIHMMNFLPDCI